MRWFKRWYHERFANHTNDSVTVAYAPDDVQKRTKRKVIRIIYDGCNDDSIVCCHRNSYWLLRRRLCNQSIDSIVASISDIDKNNCDQSAIEAKPQVTDKSEQSIIDDTQTTDIDLTARIWYGSRENFRRTNDSFVTNVNQYGNGEYDCGSLSKSKDPRLRTCKLSIVPEICCNICNPNHTSVDVKECFESDSNRIQIQYDSDGSVDSDEWPPKSFQQIEFLQHRIKELEYFISEIEDRVRSGSSSSNNSLTSGTDQSNQTCRYCDEQPLTDWVIVSIELRSSTQCETFSDDDHFLKETSSFVQYYTTSEFSGQQTIVTVHQYPSNNSLNELDYLYERYRSQASSQQEYGILETHNCAVGRLLWICKFLDFNIQTGTPSVDSLATEVASRPSSLCTSRSNSTMKFTSILRSIGRDYHSTDSVFQKENPMYPEFNYLLQDPCTSSKHSNVITAQLIQNSLSTISTIDPPKSPFKTPLKYCSTESIPEYFGLNECGDIIIHVDHICEETGFGFLVGRKKKIYCDVPYGEEVYEKPKFSLKYAVKRFFKAMSNTFCKCTVGESNFNTFIRLF